MFLAWACVPSSCHQWEGHGQWLWYSPPPSPNLPTFFFFGVCQWLKYSQPLSVQALLTSLPSFHPHQRQFPFPTFLVSFSRLHGMGVEGTGGGGGGRDVNNARLELLNINRRGSYQTLSSSSRARRAFCAYARTHAARTRALPLARTRSAWHTCSLGDSVLSSLSSARTGGWAWSPPLCPFRRALDIL